MAKKKNTVRRKPTKRRPVKISSRRNRQIVVMVLILIVAVFVWTNNNAEVSNKKTVIAEQQVSAQQTQQQPEQQQAQATANVDVDKNDDAFFEQTDGRLELPYYNSSEFIIHNEDGRYILHYDTARRSASWVAYILTRRDVEAEGVSRTTSFKSDPYVLNKNWASAASKDYTNTGFDRGHLLPSADRDGSRAENAATFFMSNVAPQEPKLNRQTWKYLEEQTRRWAQKYDSLYVVTGTLVDPNTKEINNGVDIPSAFYKAILVKVSEEWYSKAYLMPNIKTPDKNYETYSISVDELEAKAGIDLFCNMNNIEENKAEATKDNKILKK